MNESGQNQPFSLPFKIFASRGKQFILGPFFLERMSYVVDKVSKACVLFSD